LDSFRTITEPCVADIKEKGSVFKAYLLPVQSTESFFNQLGFIKEQEAKANHHCWAYRIDPDGLLERSSDDGEPSNTAGAPILRALISAELYNVAVVVVRYFGGTKLGVSGLISAYGDATRAVIDSAPVLESKLTWPMSIRFGYDQISFVERICQSPGVEIIERNQEATLTYHISVIRSNFEEIKGQLEANHLLTVRADL